MPQYFAGYEVVARTWNFLVTCEDDPAARARAQNVGYTCEADLARLNDLFGTHFEAGNTSPHTIWVNVLKGDPAANAGGWNYGYETDESSRIVINGGFTPPPPAPPPAVPPDPPPLPAADLNAAAVESPRLVFVAELAEILMDFTGYGWGRGQSAGEGLSVVLGTLLHPAGYYDTGSGPRINPWLNGKAGPPAVPPRPDFVSRTEDTDQNIVSYGCAILFINYLVYQLGHPLKDVIKAGGSTLAETYSRLTGQPAAQAFPAFNGLLQAHLGSSTTNNLRRDNIFPLLDVGHRGIQVTLADPIEKAPPARDRRPLPVRWTVKPGPLCPAAAYDFDVGRTVVEQPLFAVARGMANAAFRWSLAGVELPVRNVWTNVTVATPVTIKNPDGTTTHVANAVTLQYGILDRWNVSVLYLKTLTWAGNCQPKVTVSAKEAAITEPEVTADELVDLTTVTWLPGEKLKGDRQRCNPHFAAVNSSFWYLTAKLADLKNRPDPPFGGDVRDVLRLADQLRTSVAQYARAGHLSEAEVLRTLGTPAGVTSTDPAGPPVRARASDLRVARTAPHTRSADIEKAEAEPGDESDESEVSR